MFQPLRRLPVALILVCLALILVYWLIPSPGQILLVPTNWQKVTVWPQVQLETSNSLPGETVTVLIYDPTPWAHVKLFVNGIEATPHGYQFNQASIYEWNWSFTVPDTPIYQLFFYRDCHTGCQTWTTVTAGQSAPFMTPAPLPNELPTKLGVVFANPKRDWHNRNGRDIELTYAQLAEEDYWGVDDLATRVKTATNKGLFVLVRVDYAQGQSIPPPDDQVALDGYLNYLKRLARDERLQTVYGYVIGSGFNTDGNNTLSPGNRVTPEWYARVFNGYGTPLTHSDNAIQIIHAENPAVRVIVGPVSPWRTDQDGQIPYTINVPWLNYFNTLVKAINDSTQAKSLLGIANTAPDGFAVQAPGRPDIPEMSSFNQANEPKINMPRDTWGGAQAGFRVYQDWLSVINVYPHTTGLSVFITSTNTFDFETNTPPAQNYPTGWLTGAYEVINQEPQIVALCWFIDFFPHDAQWDFFSLTNPRGLSIDAAEEFDALLRAMP